MEDLKIHCGNCENDVSSQKGQIEIWCPKCKATLNGCGQILEYPDGRGSDYAGEEYYEEDQYA